jgi:CRP-like cAMP-binding protein
MDAAKALKQIFLFRDLPDTVIRSLAHAAEPLTVDAGYVVVTEGRPSDTLYVIHSGSCRVSKAGSGDAQDVVVLGTNQYFGEAALLDDAPRSASVVATERTELLVLRAARLKERFAKDHEAAHHFYAALATSLSRRLRQTTDDLGFARLLVKERRS